MEVVANLNSAAEWNLAGRVIQKILEGQWRGALAGLSVMAYDIAAVAH